MPIVEEKRSNISVGMRIRRCCSIARVSGVVAHLSDDTCWNRNAEGKKGSKKNEDSNNSKNVLE